MTCIRTIRAADLRDREVRQILVEGRAPLALYRLDGAFYATDDLCTHGEVSLADGDIDGEEIVCPFHRGAFDIRSGEATRAPCGTALVTYPVRIDAGGIVCIDLA